MEIWEVPERPRFCFKLLKSKIFNFFAASFCLRFVVDAATNQFWLHMGASVPEAYIGRGFNSRLWSFDIKLNGHQVSFDIRLNFWSSGNKWELLWVEENIHHSRGGICHCRHYRWQCKIFASGVNFSRNDAIYSINEGTKRTWIPLKWLKSVSVGINAL